jgi:hypothetical protein
MRAKAGCCADRPAERRGPRPRNWWPAIS